MYTRAHIELFRQSIAAGTNEGVLIHLSRIHVFMLSPPSALSPSDISPRGFPAFQEGSNLTPLNFLSSNYAEVP